MARAASTHGIRRLPEQPERAPQLIASADGYYSYGRPAPSTMRELLANEALPSESRRPSVPDFCLGYFGYEKRQYARVRELESVVARTITSDLDRAGLGLRLRYLSGGQRGSDGRRLFSPSVRLLLRRTNGRTGHRATGSRGRCGQALTDLSARGTTAATAKLEAASS